MSSTGRHASSSALGIPARLGVTTAVVGLLAVTVIIGAVAAHSAGPGPTSAARSAASRARPALAGPSAVSVNAAPVARANAVPALTRLGRQPGGVARVAARAHQATMPLVLTAADHRHCPAAAAACVDLTRHLTWLQSNGKTTFGPIQMEPGKP